MADESTDRVARGFPRALPASDTWCGSSNETGPHRAAPRRPGPAKSPENDPHGGTSALLAVQLPSKPEPRTAARPQAGEKGRRLRRRYHVARGTANAWQAGFTPTNGLS